MNWDRGFKRLYIALTVLFFIGSVFVSYKWREESISVPYTKELSKNKDYECYAYKDSDGKQFGNCRVPVTQNEQLLSALGIFSRSLLFWVCLSAIWFLIRWVFMGFKKTSSARNWPEGPDE